MQNLLPRSILVSPQSPIPIKSMFASVSNSSIKILRHCALRRPRVLTLGFSSLLHRFGASAPMDNGGNNRFSSYAHASPRLLPISPKPSSKLTNFLSLSTFRNASVVNFEGFVRFRECDCEWKA